MESIGHQLQQARIAKKQSLAKISRLIHIRENYLEAMERDALGELPSPVQARGFLRLYWSYLGLPEDALEELLKTDEIAIPQNFDSIMSPDLKPAQKEKKVPTAQISPAAGSRA